MSLDYIGDLLIVSSFKQLGIIWIWDNGTLIFNPLTPNRFCTIKGKRACLLFMHAFSVCPQYKMRHRRGVRPPVVHFVLPTTEKVCRKSKQAYYKLIKSCIGS